MDAKAALRLLPICAALLAAPQAAAVEAPRASAAAERSNGTPPLDSQTALDAWLRDHAGRRTPFDALPPGARERFLLSLRWGSRGLGGFDAGVLADELPQPQIDAILRLFGEPVARHAPESRLLRQAPAKTAKVAAGEIGPLERRYNDFYRAMHAQDDADRSIRVARLGERFDALLADAYAAQALRNVDDRHLAMLWNAAASAAQLTKQARHVAALEAVFAEGLRRSAGQPANGRVRTMRDVLLAARRFDDARRLGARHPLALGPLPEFVEPNVDDRPAHGVWRMSADGSRLTHEALDLSGTRILVTAGCHFSVDAAADISADPILGPVFIEHASWLMLPPGEEDIDAVRDWNRRFPRAQALMVQDRDAWPMPGDWPMPEFHLLRDGRIVETLTGWPRGDARQRDALVAMLRRADLLPAGPASP